MNRSHHISLALTLLVVVVNLLLTTCKEVEYPDAFFEEDELLISAYLEEHADDVPK